MSASYLRADTVAICDCIQAFGLNDLLFSIARLERLFKRSCNGAPRLCVRCGTGCACSDQQTQPCALRHCSGRGQAFTRVAADEAVPCCVFLKSVPRTTWK